MRIRRDIGCKSGVGAGRGLLISGVLLGALGTGCGADPGSGTPGEPSSNVNDVGAVGVTEEELILRATDRLGFARGEVEIDGEFVRAEGDLVMSRDALLKGAYEPSPAILEEKGYRYLKNLTSPVSRSKVGNIKLVFRDESGHFPTNASNIKSYFVFAGSWEWPGFNLSLGTFADSIRVSETNTGPTITIHYVNASNWPTGSGCPAKALACTTIPTGDGNPGKDIWIRDSLNPFGNPGQCDWTTSTIAKVTAHELGHALGMAHPKEVNSAGTTIGFNIDGTKSCTTTAAKCLDPALTGYLTVMNNVNFNAYPSCTTPDANAVTADDLLSAQKLYP